MEKPKISCTKPADANYIMAGLYLHIPFCKQACHYCNFHFSTSLLYMEDMVAALLKEIDLRHQYLREGVLDSIYFGGGTPSLLKEPQLAAIFERIARYFSVHPNAEITLEANPDDLSADYLQMLALSPVNRLSIGIQSFFEEDLRFMHRAHNAAEAIRSIRLAQEAGFQNITIDLIYGSPTTPHAHWHHNVATALEMEIPHISAYALTVEPKTALAHQIKTGKAPMPDDGLAEEQFHYLSQTLTQTGFLHYEISNFGLPNAIAKHNTAYWQGKPYLGIGPSAHSFNGHSRQWNVANNAKYLQAVAALAPDAPPQHWAALFDKEDLSDKDRYNELVMTGLRTMWGVQQASLPEAFQLYFAQQAQLLVEEGVLLYQSGHYILHPAHRFMADGIAAGMFA